MRLLDDIHHRSDPRELTHPGYAISSRAHRVVVAAAPVKSREFPAKQERLVTPDELVQYGI